MSPFIEDLCRFDFEVSPEDEYMVGGILRGFGQEVDVDGVTSGSEDSVGPAVKGRLYTIKSDKQ